MKLTRDDWIDAAYEALLAGGPQNVSVAALSKSLGATRGSFYHYFKDRDALLAAALRRWEHDAVDAFIEAASVETDPTRRLDRLLSQVLREPSALATAERHLLTGRGDSVLIAETVDRAIERRRAFLTDCYRALGFGPTEAADRAIVAYMLFTGWLYLDAAISINESALNRVAEISKQLLLHINERR